MGCQHIQLYLGTLNATPFFISKIGNKHFKINIRKYLDKCREIKKNA